MNPDSEAGAAETRTLRRSDDADEGDDTPFEWLTSFGSLRHLVLPSRILAGSARADAAAATAPRRLDALHVGCGTSAAGEALLRLRERAGTRVLQYGRVTNVDNDRQALDRMQKRWEKGRAQRADERAAAPSDGMGTMDWKYLDFKREETCRSALDAIGGGFDLVLDKGTLDCLLCKETCVAAQYFLEVHRALRVPVASEGHAHGEAGAEAPAGGGGAYVVVTFHPVAFVERLLTRLPGADWRVEHEVVAREAEDLEEDGAWGADDTASPAARADAGAGGDARSPLPSAWSSGTFSPDDACHNTVAVFTCRRRRTVTGGEEPAPGGLDRERVRQHIEQTCDNWYQDTNPMVTSEREQQLRRAFAEEAAAPAATRGGPGEGKAAREDTVLDLKRCYELMFTEAERDHLAYEYFLEDWAAYCELASKADALHSPEGMTVNVALDFLKEMQ